MGPSLLQGYGPKSGVGFSGSSPVPSGPAAPGGYGAGEFAPIACSGVPCVVHRGCLALVALGSSLVRDRWELRFGWAMALVPMETVLQPASEYMAECGRTCRHSLQLPETA